MSLENLVGIHQLHRHSTNAAEVARLLAAARRNLTDSHARSISDETRFDAAYKCIMQCGVVALYASGYRPSTTTPGHHQTIIQTLELTMSVPPSRWKVLDALRKKRNQSDYSGDLVEPAAVQEAVLQARSLLETTCAWLQAHHPELLPPP